MYNYITLLSKTWDYEQTIVRYGFLTENITVNSHYIDKNNHCRRSKEYFQTEVGKKVHKKGSIKYDATKKGKKTRYDYRQTEAYKASQKKFEHSEKGTKHRARGNARRRNFQWIQMFKNPFSDKEDIEWHHITNVYVVAIPTDLHQLYNGYKKHREMCMEIVKQVYLGGN